MKNKQIDTAKQSYYYYIKRRVGESVQAQEKKKTGLIIQSMNSTFFLFTLLVPRILAVLWYSLLLVPYVRYNPVLFGGFQILQEVFVKRFVESDDAGDGLKIHMIKGIKLILLGWVYKKWQQLLHQLHFMGQDQTKNNMFLQYLHLLQLFNQQQLNRRRREAFQELQASTQTIILFRAFRMLNFINS